MKFIGLIITDLASVITIVAMWGIGNNSPLAVRVVVTVLAVFFSVATLFWSHRRRYKVKGYSRDNNDNSKVAYLLISNKKIKK